jgi:hypothetical protein
VNTWQEHWFDKADEVAVRVNAPKRRRKAAQRALRRQQYAIVAQLDAHRDLDGRHYAGWDWARYRDSRGWLGVDRYIQGVLAMHRRARRAPERTPWGTLLADWTPDKRCAGSFAEDASGTIVHHDDPRAVRWCLAGWLAHRCQRPEEQSKHFRTQAERDADIWWRRTDDKEAERLLDEVWALVPDKTRGIVERIRRDRVPVSDRQRLDQHPLGYWWLLAPHLAARLLKIAV